MRYDYKKIVIAGAGISGKGAFELAKQKGFEPEYYLNESSLNDATLAVVSPGFPLDHEVFLFCKNKNIPIIGEIEFGYGFFSKPIIAVTGTNGKTSTVKLLNEIFKADGIKSVECGNIGKSFCSVVKENNADVAILEVSSFQLQTIVDFRPDIGIILNIGEDHLDRHHTRENYAAAKLSLAKNMQLKDSLILGGEIECELLENFVPKCKIYFVGAETSVGVYEKDNKIFFGDRFICQRGLIKMKGEHNLQNAMAAIAGAKIFGISDRAIGYALENFTPPHHRIEYIDTIAGKKFYNDSKGTNIDATLAAVKAIEGKICLLVGGSDKCEDFGRLFKNLDERVCAVIAMGAIKNKILSAARKFGFENIEIADGLEDAVKIAVQKNCDIVLLSPAAASFDRYNGYAERGEHFVSLVKDLKK